MLATEAFSGGGLPEGMTVGSQFMAQAGGVVLTFVWTAVISFAILKLIAMVVPLRVSHDVEIEGLDLAQHGERGYSNN